MKERERGRKRCKKKKGKRKEKGRREEKRLDGGQTVGAFQD